MQPTNVVASWQVAGENYKEMVIEASSDAEFFMQDFLPSTWEVWVIGCEPMKTYDNDGHVNGRRIENGRVVEWEGTAVIVWAATQSSQSLTDAVQAG